MKAISFVLLFFCVLGCAIQTFTKSIKLEKQGNNAYTNPTRQLQSDDEDVDDEHAETETIPKIRL